MRTNYIEAIDNVAGMAKLPAVAAIQTGRQYIGFELSGEYCEIARKRIKGEMKN